MSAEFADYAPLYTTRFGQTDERVFAGLREGIYSHLHLLTLNPPRTALGRRLTAACPGCYSAGPAGKPQDGRRAGPPNPPTRRQRVSDARPITNVTDFVCSSCWNSFSRHDPGVDRGDHVVCPHCGLQQAAEPSHSLVDAVNAAPARRAISDGFDSPGPQTLQSFGIPQVDHAPISAGGHGWLPPDLVARSAEPAGFVVGEPDDFDDFEFSEQTLRPDLSHEGLLQAVRTTQTPVAVIDQDADIGVDEPTPPEGHAPLEALQPEQRDWKLKAIGLTYNFHGLDALIGWASNKAGQAMQISQDGNVWRDFTVFFALYRAGVPADKAFADAANPEAAADTVAAAAAQARPTSKALPPELLPPGRDDAKNPSSRANPAAARPASGSIGSGGTAGGSTASGSTASGAATKANSPARPIASTKASGGSQAAKRPAAAAAAQAEPPTSRGVQIAAALAVLALVVVAVLAWQGVISLPGFK